MMEHATARAARFVVPALVAFGTLGLAWPGSAQTIGDIVAQHVAARGGAAALLAVESVRMTGRMQMGPEGDEARFVLELKRPNKMRLDLTVDGVEGAQAFDGTAGWAFMPFAGLNAPEPMPQEVAADAKAQADFDGPLVDHQAKGLDVRLIGRERRSNEDVYRVRVTPKAGTSRDIFISARTWLEVGSETTRRMQGVSITTETTQGGERRVAGVVFPTFMQAGIKGQPGGQRMEIDDIQVNVAIDDSRFRMPSQR
ncbi:MAG: outer membrane lipoprotein carrier protein LolA [Vicinamibacterales bacterium]